MEMVFTNMEENKWLGILYDYLKANVVVHLLLCISAR